jgi:hypothetical protein
MTVSWVRAREAGLACRPGDGRKPHSRAERGRGRHRLGPDRHPLRPPAATAPQRRCRAQPGDRRDGAPRPGRCPRRPRRDRPAGLPPVPRHQGRGAPPGRTWHRGRRRAPPSHRPHQQRGRAAPSHRIWIWLTFHDRLGKQGLLRQATASALALSTQMIPARQPASPPKRDPVIEPHTLAVNVPREQRNKQGSCSKAALRTSCVFVSGGVQSRHEQRRPAPTDRPGCAELG